MDEQIKKVETTNYLPLALENEVIAWLCWEGGKRPIEPALLKIEIEEIMSMDKTKMEIYSKVKEEEEMLVKDMLDSQA